MTDREALYYDRIEGGAVRCRLCPHECLITDGHTGICGIRRNRGGRLLAESYGQVTAIAMDPIEKKPLYHFHPGSRILSIGTRGCNLKCPYCQNWHISQDTHARATSYDPETIVSMALRERSVGIAYTYSEPLVWYEFVRDTAIRAHERGLVNVLVTNGFINRAPLDDLLPHIDAMNIDLKSCRDDTYRRVQKGALADVQACIARAREAHCHVEVTTLVVTGLNDTLDELRDAVDFIASVDPSIPWHLSRYFPNYHYDREPTDVDFIMTVYREAKKKLPFVYVGNVQIMSDGSDTYCPSCNALAVARRGYSTRIAGLTAAGTCGHCGATLNMIV